MHYSTYSNVLLVICLGLSIFGPTTTLAGFSKSDNLHKIRLADVQTLTFTRDDYTTARRSSPIPQMKCTGENCQYAPSSAMCRNIGLDGHDVVWQCEASFPRGVKFRHVSVSCEGYAYPEDEHVLYGSCGLKYTVEGKPVFPEDVLEKQSSWSRMYSSISEYSHSFWPLSLITANTGAFSYAWPIFSFLMPSFLLPTKSHTQSFLNNVASLFQMAIQILVLIFICWIIYRVFFRRNRRPSRRTNSSTLGLNSLLPFGISRVWNSITSMMPSTTEQQENINTYPSENTNIPPPSYSKHDPRTQRHSTTQAQSQSSTASTGQSGIGANFSHGFLGGGLLGLLLGRRWGARTAEATERDRNRERIRAQETFENDVLRHRRQRHEHSPARSFVGSPASHHAAPESQPVSVAYGRTERR
jgi:hypothetical protein